MNKSCAPQSEGMLAKKLVLCSGCTTPIFLQGKSSKTSSCARLAAFSLQNEERAFQKCEMTHG
jgi:hypothetical protein